MAITIKDIAKESGYAVGTVSRVLNNHPDVSDTARTKIMEVVGKYHFRLNNNAKHLKQQSSNGIAIIIKGSQNMLFAPIVEKMQNMLLEKGFATLIYYISEMENELETAIQICAERRPVGIMFLGCNLQYFPKRFPAITVPCVLVTNSAESLGVDNLSSVSIDDAEAAKAAVNHLLQLGHRSIGILGGFTDKSKVAQTRYKGCAEAFRENDMDFDADRQYIASMFTIKDGYNSMKTLLERIPHITAVFAMSDVMALGAVRAIKDAGLIVPRDISVVGFDGIELSEYLSPSLTTIKQDKETIAKRSVEILLANIGKKQPAVHETVPFTVIVGEITTTTLSGGKTKG